MKDRVYQRKRKLVEKFIKKQGKIDHSIILNNVDVDYDTLMKIHLSTLPVANTFSVVRVE